MIVYLEQQLYEVRSCFYNLKASCSDLEVERDSLHNQLIEVQDRYRDDFKFVYIYIYIYI